MSVSAYTLAWPAAPRSPEVLAAVNPLASPVARLRAAGLAEGTSYLLLLTASVVKRAAGYADPVFVVGAAHGVLFVLFVACVAEMTVRRPWYSPRFWLYAVLAAVVPGGTFALDGWVRRHAGGSGRPRDAGSTI